MEALDFLKLHNLYSHFSSMVHNSNPFLTTSDFYEDDSFFELEFISSPFSEPRISISTEKSNLYFPQSDSISKRKILPIELSSSSSKTESPVSVLKSAPRLSISLFKKPKLMTKPKTNETEREKESPERQSKRFSRERMKKYLKLIKPLYVKVSKRYNYRTSSPPENSPAEHYSTDEKQRNIAIGIRVACRRLRKCKSSSSASSPAMIRRDDSLLQQDDGIESAILHCKRSFSSSRDASLVEDGGGDGGSDDNRFQSGELEKQKAGKDVLSEAKEGEGH